MTKKEPKKDTSKMFGFRTRDKKTIEELEKIPHLSEFISQHFEDFFNGKLIPIDVAMKTIEMSELKFREKKASIIKKEISAKREMIHDLKIQPSDVVDIMNNKKSIYSIGASKDIIQADGSLRCFTCGIILQMRGYNFQQVDDYEKHVRDSHDRKLFDNEMESMRKVLGMIET